MWASFHRPALRNSAGLSPAWIRMSSASQHSNAAIYQSTNQVSMRFWSAIHVPDVFTLQHFSQMLCRKPTLYFSLLVRRCGAVMVTPILVTFMTLLPKLRLTSRTPPLWQLSRRFQWALAERSSDDFVNLGGTWISP